ncbi:MAG: hypothetical protein U1C97_01100, partial [Candidatus Gracilibacteria bacterium]|nr:hypothetical protein [Candidatus Gracilibacteria bacterium]
STGDVKKTTDHAHGNSIPPSENPTVIAESITPDDSIMLPSSEENTPIAIPPNTKNPKLLKKWYRKLLETIEPPEPEATISSYGIKKLTEILGGNETHILNALITRCEDIRKSGKQITCVLHEPCTRELKLVRKLKRLNILSIRGNIRCPNLLEVLKEHPNISELEISEEGKRISNIGLNIKDDDLRHLESFPKLQKLILNNCLVLSDEGMKHLSQLNLTRLELSGCLKTAKTPGITGSGLANLHPSLQHLQLADNPITDENLHHLAHLTNLEFLGLSGCTEITGTDFGWLENMTQLKRLQLRTHQTRGRRPWQTHKRPDTTPERGIRNTI